MGLVLRDSAGTVAQRVLVRLRRRRIALLFDGSGAIKYRYLHGPSADAVLAEEDAAGSVDWMLAGPR